MYKLYHHYNDFVNSKVKCDGPSTFFVGGGETNLPIQY